MSKQAWRFVLKKGDKNTTGRVRETERQRGETKRREEKVRGTAQESFSHEATQHKKQTTEIKKKKKTTTHQSPHTVNRTEL